MRIPRYWARGSASGMDASGRTVNFECWGWSDESQDKARRMGQDRSDRALSRALAGERLESYEYGVLPLHEEIVDVIAGRDKREAAIVTRNSYGALVLNAANAMFIDIDFHSIEPSFFGRVTGSIKSIFGGRAGTPEDIALKRVRDWAEVHRDLDLKVYRTFAGLRCLVTNMTFDPAQESTRALMRELGCDPLYLRLCGKQESFRARLTPKPFRMNMHNPWFKYRPESRSGSDLYDKWIAKYEEASRGFTVCREIERIGDNPVHPDIEAIVLLHDRHCLRDDRLPLA